MNVKFVDSAVGHRAVQQYAFSLLVNDRVAFDAGSIGWMSPLISQRRIQHVFLSHSHMDHIASLPVFLDNVYEPTPDCPAIYASRDVLACLERHIFNDVVWPDFVRLSSEETPFLRLHILEDFVPVRAAGLQVTPVPLVHLVPMMGFIIDDGEAAIGLVSDTLPSDAIWQQLNATANLKAVFLEASFPNSMQSLADKAYHLTPNTFQSELRKLDKHVPILAIHLKPAFRDTIVREIAAFGLPNVQIAVPGESYGF